MKTSGFIQGQQGPAGPTGTNGGGGVGNYVGTGFFGPGFPNAGTLTPDTMTVHEAISLLRQPATYYPIQFGLGIQTSASDTSNATAIVLGNHIDTGDGGPMCATHSVNIGTNTGQVNQGYSDIAIGYQAGNYNQRGSSLAIGSQAGYNHQGSCSVAVGYNAGWTSQGLGSLAIGSFAGYSAQGSYSIAIGSGAGAFSQGINSIAVGYTAGLINQQQDAVAIGYIAGQTSQGASAIAIGDHAGRVGQSTYSVAIGSYAGTNIGTGAIGIGDHANTGNTLGGISSIAIGTSAGRPLNGNYCIGIGSSAGQYTVNPYSIAIGANVTNYDASGNEGGIAIGPNTNQYSMGANSIAIGAESVLSDLPANVIFINATGTPAATSTSGSLTIKPVRNAVGSANMFYVPVTAEITWGSINPSSVKYKENINPVTDEGASSLLKLKPVSFTYKQDKRDACGFIAEDVYDVLSELVLRHKVTDEIETIDYAQMTTLLLKLLQSQHVTIKQNNTILKSLINV